ncbi:MAG: protein-disulfide reductase DsbD family protein, partial [Aquabacterium sp.]
INHAARPDARWQGDTWTARVPLDPQRAESPAVLPVVLIANGMPAGLRVEVAMTTPWAPTNATASMSANSGAAQPGGAVSTPTPGLLLALGLALVGGALLNLMPCVFPVLSLKVLGFATQPQGRRAVLAGGLAYTAGVVLSFVGLAGLLLALRAGGEQLGWGFQLQSPPVVAALATLFTLIALNLAGVFEFGNLLPSAWASARARHPVVDAFLTGVLAVAVASPCTAPFMGAALGAALSWPAAPALLVFAALGLGMAAPYLAASAWPALARLLPRPGPWMAHFRSLMAFPMWATVIWLTWVLGVQVGADGVAALLALLLALAFLAWTQGSPTLGPGARRRLGAVAAMVLVAVLVWAGPSLRTDPAVAATADSGGDAWQPWSPQRVAQAQAEGRTIFVDFTAAWCVTCQFNKRTTLASAEVQAVFAQHRVLLLRADWTRRDATISAELARMGRSGVPAYVVFLPGAAAPSVLSEILTVSEVLAAIRPAR